MNRDTQTNLEKDTLSKTQDLKSSQKSQADRPDPLNDNATAIPKDRDYTPDQMAADPDLGTQMDYGKMNLEDAKESGYTDKEGHAISKARKDVPGSPTGAYTDIGAGRSSVVHYHKKDSDSHH